MQHKDLDQIADYLVENYDTKAALSEKGGILAELSKRIFQKALEAEMTNHLGYEKHERTGKKNTRNGYSKKTIMSSHGHLELKPPRDREGTFEPQIIKKNQRRVGALDSAIQAIYARGSSVQEIKELLKELYGVECSTSLISDVTQVVLEDVKAWQNRPLEALYPVVYFDCMFIKTRAHNQIVAKALYLALGINKEGHKELLGMWISENEGAKFWLGVLTELKNRGVQDILIACIDGLKGFPEAIEAVYPKTKIQLCIVHMIRNSVKYVSWKDRKLLIRDLKAVYTAPTEQAAKLGLGAFKEKWHEKYPYVVPAWERNWERLTTYFSYPNDIRKIIYTTNAIESLNMTLRSVIKKKRVFPNDESVLKAIYLAIERISKRWTMPIIDWPRAMNHFIIEFGEERMGM